MGFQMPAVAQQGPDSGPTVAQQWLDRGSSAGMGPTARRRFGKAAENGQKQPLAKRLEGLPKGLFQGFFVEVASRCPARPSDFGVYQEAIQQITIFVDYQLLIYIFNLK